MYTGKRHVAQHPAIASRLAHEGSLTASLSFVDCVHIRFLGNGDLGFRPYGDSLFLQAPKKSKQKKRSPRTCGPSPGLGVPSLRHSSGGIALRSAARDLHAMSSTASNGATRHSPDEHLHSACRGAGGSRSKAAGELTLGPVGASLLAMVVNDNAGCLNARGVLAFFASKLAPTGERRSVVIRPAGRPPRFCFGF
ncbi:hypothetical protein AN403_1790 [Pseudomonas fluorescens]|uniref:Uncharacterized protein n=1 Tax=Pseudomonas fluorescens TaxID=294 RepID=A0A0N8NW06_PSEFL|nr:hypothetical protein AN403_1790 [Pseudomonas fluorescens]